MLHDRRPILGQIVKSKAGHDSGNVFFVVGISDDNHVLLADGDRRRIERPKTELMKP